MGVIGRALLVGGTWTYTLDQSAVQDLDAGDVAALTTTSLDALEPWVRSYLPGLTVAMVVPLAAGLLSAAYRRTGNGLNCGTST